MCSTIGTEAATLKSLGSELTKALNVVADLLKQAKATVDLKTPWPPLRMVSFGLMPIFQVQVCSTGT